jgi:divalent metal cation (Fe/Co/Zn/Cd) transporter
VIRLVWLFLFINVYWWGNSLPTGTSFKFLVLPIWSTSYIFLYSLTVSCIIFFVVVLLDRSTNLQKMIPIDSKKLFFITNIIGLGVMLISSSYRFELGSLIGFSILMYNLYTKFGSFYFDSFLLDLKQRLVAVSESFTIICLVVMIYAAFSFNYIYICSNFSDVYVNITLF